MASVRDIQTALSNKGFDPGGIDGIWGRNTIKAVRACPRAARVIVSNSIAS